MDFRAKANVLLIDDEDSIRETLAPAIEQAGFNAQCACDGTSAVEMAKQTFFDVFIVDYRLPDTDGLKLIKDILLVSNESVPIIVSGSSSIEIAVAAMRMGAHDYLVKPINIEDLVSIITTILDERAAFVKGKANRQKVLQQLGNVAADTGIITVIQNKQNQSLTAQKGLFAKLAERYKQYFNPA